MSKIEKDVERLKTLRAFLVGGASAIAFGVSGMAFAQDETTTDEEDGVTVIEEEVAAEEGRSGSGDTVVVTGSRVKRDTFSSIAPLQVISADVSREVGLIDPATILQDSTAATGQQIDLTFQGFVLDNGPGSSTINLRGLGAGRTLTMINGRRLGPGGVEGAPTSPDLNIIPGLLVDRYDILLDGASSVYGSDAVAGVVNAIMRTDFDGFEIEAYGTYAEQGNGEDYSIAGSWGKNTDRGYFGVAVEISHNEEVTLADRDFTDQCDTNYEVTSDGDIRTVAVAGQDQRPSPCKAAGLVGRTFIFNSFGSIYYDPTNANTGIGGFSESSLGGVAPDTDGDGIADISFVDFATNGHDLDGSLYPQQNRQTIMAVGEHTFDGDMNLTAFGELLVSRRETKANEGDFQFFPYVPATNPFNICNVANYDCNAALNQWAVTYLGFNLGRTEGVSLPTEPIVSIEGDRTRTKSELTHTRLVGGFRGDLPGMNFGSLSNFSFEVSGVYSLSDGTSSRVGIRDDRLALALGWDPTLDFDGDGVADVSTSNYATLYELPGGACDVANVANPGLLQPDAAAGCVPVNLYAPSLYNPVVGSLSSQAEHDYLFDSRDFTTKYTQTIFNGFISGDVFELPAGKVAVALGAEWRKDEIESLPDAVAEQGLFFGFFADGGAVGERTTKEVFGEVVIPLLANHPLAREMNLELSGRITDDEFYGTNDTYSAKFGWRPIDPLLLRATYGTSFRAPNLRELFLRSQSGFNTLTDPCAVPVNAWDSVNLVYIPGNDLRDPQTIANCQQAGLDPFSLGVNPSTGLAQVNYSTEISTGGTFDLEPETSESWSAGFVFEQPFFDSFDLTLSGTYYDLEVTNTIIEPSAQFILNDCYIIQPGLTSNFCDRINRDSQDLLNFVEGGFLNRDKDTTSGIDYNARFGKELTMFNRPVDLSIDLALNQLLESTSLFVDQNGNPSFNEFVGESFYPDWKGTMQTALAWDDYRLSWQTSYRTGIARDEATVAGEPFGNSSTGTCANDAPLTCRDVYYTDTYYLHNLSLFYRGDTWTMGAGVRNVFDTSPPLVDSSEILAVNNAPIGQGYDLNGRTYFVNISKKFN